MMTTEEWNDKPAGGPRMTTTTTLAETILRDVPTYDLWYEGGKLPFAGATWMTQADVLAALTAAMDPATVERAGELARSDDPKVMLYHGEYVEALRSLIAQNAALRAERDALQWVADEGKRLRAEAEAQIAALTARVEGLTGALNTIFQVTSDGDVEHIARAALTTEEGHE